MKLATLRLPGRTAAARLDGDEFVETQATDVGALLADADWAQAAAAANGPRHAAATADLAPVVPHPSKIICVGLNYRTHILEMGRDLPEYPTLFAKFTDTLTGPNDPVEVPAEDPEVDWEAELVVVIGKEGRRIDETEALGHIAGYTVANDISMRGWQFRTKEWLQGKAWQASTPLGPVLATPDELGRGARVSTTVNGQVMQDATIGDLVFGPAALVAYVSTMTVLRPGDLILTGTTGGVGRARKPPVYLRPGDEVITAVGGIGELRTPMVAG
ncbi:fumarylacetoacetate hydrolase family protein [Naumannella huperziae]